MNTKQLIYDLRFLPRVAGKAGMIYEYETTNSGFSPPAGGLEYEKN